ncbi:hypothetical protein C8R47DRAFT_1324264, partial [Mycena vitilis]
MGRTSKKGDGLRRAIECCIRGKSSVSTEVCVQLAVSYPLPLPPRLSLACARHTGDTNARLHASLGKSLHSCEPRACVLPGTPRCPRKIQRGQCGLCSTTLSQRASDLGAPAHPHGRISARQSCERSHSWSSAFLSIPHTSSSGSSHASHLSVRLRVVHLRAPLGMHGPRATACCAMDDTGNCLVEQCRQRSAADVDESRCRALDLLDACEQAHPWPAQPVARLSSREWDGGRYYPHASRKPYPMRGQPRAPLHAPRRSTTTPSHCASRQCAGSRRPSLRPLPAQSLHLCLAQSAAEPRRTHVPAAPPHRHHPSSSPGGKRQKSSYGALLPHPRIRVCARARRAAAPRPPSSRTNHSSLAKGRRVRSSFRPEM